jgi:hypothetical protein
LAISQPGDLIMMIDSISAMKTNQGLLDAVRAAPQRLSPHEIFEQKASFVYGSLDRNNNMTKEQVRRVIRAQGGELVSK